MDALSAIETLRRGEKPEWPTNTNSLDFAQSLDNVKELPRWVPRLRQ